MKITTQCRLALLAVLSLLAFMVFATGIQAAQAAAVEGSGAESGTAVVAAHDPGATAGPAAVQGTTAVRLDAHAGRISQVANASPARSVSSTTAWIVFGSIAAAVAVILVWVLARSRRQPAVRPSAAYCAQHPEDPVCMTT